MVLALQRSAGNAATAALLGRPTVQRGGASSSWDDDRPLWEDPGPSPTWGVRQPIGPPRPIGPPLPPGWSPASGARPPAPPPITPAQVPGGPPAEPSSTLPEAPLPTYAVALPSFDGDDRATRSVDRNAPFGGDPSGPALAAFVDALAAYRATVLATHAVRERAAREARQAARRDRRSAAETTRAVSDAVAAVSAQAIEADAGPIRTATVADLTTRFGTALRGRLGHERDNARFSDFARWWCSEERERVMFQTEEVAAGRGRYNGWTRFLSPNADQLAEAGAEHLEPIDRAAHGTGTPVAPYTNRVLRALAASPPGVAYTADNYFPHGVGAWARSGLCLDLRLSGRDGARDDRGFYDPRKVMALLVALDAACASLGGSWQGCYDDFSVARAARRQWGANRLAYVNDARANNHGPLLLHVHVDLLPPNPPAAPPPITAPPGELSEAPR